MSTQANKKKAWTLAPLFGSVLFVVLYLVAASLYPGGSHTKPLSRQQNCMGMVMGSLGIEPHLSIAQIKEQLYGQGNGRHASYWQIILTLSLAPGKQAKDYAALLGCSERKLYRIRALYNKEGPAFAANLSWGGRREQRCLLSFEEEETLLHNWEATALQGGVLVAKQLRNEVENKISRKVSDDYLWDLFNRHGWTKKVPRPEHPGAEEAKQKRAVFKKKHPHSLPQQLKMQNR